MRNASDAEDAAQEFYLRARGKGLPAALVERILGTTARLRGLRAKA